MYEIAICDDDAAFAAELQAMLTGILTERGESSHISLYSAPSELLRALESGERCDLIFQDVLFDAERGIRFAKHLREKKWDMDVVFVTTCADYALDGYAAYQLSYLLKPVPRERLAEVMDRFLERHTPRVLRLSTSRGAVRIEIADVLYFEIFNHAIVFHKVDGSSQSWTGTLKELEAALPPRCFVRPHRSYLVNLSHITEITRSEIKLSSGDSVPISKNLYHKVQLSLVEYDDSKSTPPH